MDLVILQILEIYIKENYRETINFLTKNNYFVIRVGRAAEYKFNLEKNFLIMPFQKLNLIRWICF